MKSKILVVDVEVDICSSWQERLAMEGYQVRTVPDGRKGSKLYYDLQVDLVITDVLMPELDSLEVVRTLRRLSTSLPIIVMSAVGNRDLVFLVKAEEFGATRTISKPFRLDELAAMVHELLDFTPQHAL